MTQLGELSLWIALLMSAWCVTLSVQGALLRREPLARSGARGLHAAAFFSVIAFAGLAYAFLTNDFALRYVALHSSGYLQPVYKVGAIWSGVEGMGLLLVSAFSLAAAGVVSPFAARDPDRPRAAMKVAALGVLLLAGISLSAFGANPFARIARAPSDGRGLDPVLQHPAMLMAPPLLALGAGVAVVVLAMIVSSLARGSRGGVQRTQLRASALVAWTLLNVALLVGLHWAYVSPQLRGYWNRAPFEIAAASTWIALTALLVALAWNARVQTHVNVLRRRAAMVMAGTGALLIVLAVGARPFSKNYDAQLSDGAQFRAKDAWGHDWVFTSQGASRIERPGADVIAVALLSTRDGVRQPFVTSESRDYYGAEGLNVFPPFTAPGVRSTLLQDLYVVLSDAGEGRAVLRISFKPLVELAWIGGVLFCVGGLLLFWPSREELPS